MTVKEFWEYSNRPENSDRILDLIRGEVVESPIPYVKHGVVCARVGSVLHEYAQRAGVGFVTLNNAEVILFAEPASVIGPDVAYFTSATADGEYDTGWDEALPALAVEVLSANEDVNVVNSKVTEYLRNEVPMVWLIDCEERTVTVYRPIGTPSVLKENDVLPLTVVISADTIWQDRVFPEFQVRVCELFMLPAELARK